MNLTKKKRKQNSLRVIHINRALVEFNRAYFVQNCDFAYIGLLMKTNTRKQLTELNHPGSSGCTIGAS